MRLSLLSFVFGLMLTLPSESAQPKFDPPHLSGIYPHLAFFNHEGECGTGAVVPWAGRLWAVTYAPHQPRGSSDKLYEITPELDLIVRPESIGGTPANRMIHRESQQLFLGPYVIDDQAQVRVIPYEKMFGRPTGNARHLFDPAHKIYSASMEEAFYEIDVTSLEVTELFRDEQQPGGRKAGLPGYHGKGLYSGQGRLIYANNGEHGGEAQKRPDIPSGCLAEWDGRSKEWRVVRRNQFTEVTGPGGIYGSAHPDTDPVWAIGWDHRSLILMLLDKNVWHSYRLPKASHSYDGAHGWNTEWPRIRDIGEKDLLMTMHGMFWRFPKHFTAQESAGISPRSTYLKVIGDFCRWQDRIVFGCDDTAQNEFLNKRKAKGEIAAPQSQSNLWFVDPNQLDHLGPVLGRGAVWLRDDVEAGTPSEPFLFSGFEERALHLSHDSDHPATITLEVDAGGHGQWEPFQTIKLPAKHYRWIDLTTAQPSPWIRLTSDRPLKNAVAWFHYRNQDQRTSRAAPIFAGLASPDDTRLTGGIIRARHQNKRTLHYVATKPGDRGPQDIGLYELNERLQLRHVDDPDTRQWQKTHAAIPAGVLAVDEASVIFTDETGKRWRLPKGNKAFDETSLLGSERVDREVATERDLFNAHGTFYELPADNAGGFAKLRPVTTHNRRIIDYCSYRGLLIISGVAVDASRDNPHIIRSDDGETALWAGAIDDIWKLGKPVGTGGPWLETTVDAGAYSDPYLMTGYDRKKLRLQSSADTDVSVEIDVDGTGLWKTYRTLSLDKNKSVKHTFPPAFQAYWIRFRSSNPAIVTAQLEYD